ncbi:hypothetical protein FQA39_LY17336 [Lamprigera yunnana]|nr:hypothetical protein FQA39_LY17336 [Lamprigera yunnana]
MSELCDQQEQLNLLPSDKILDESKDADPKTANSGDTYKVELSEKKRYFIKNERVQQFLFKMYLVVKEVAIIAFITVVYAALTNDTPKFSKSPAAFPFFPKTSIITDWYLGELSAAITKAREADISFVMFYAAWDAQSQTIREEFDQAARYMQKEISFAAVNCWQPGSECRKQYSKAYSWPVLIAYPTHGKGIQYKGPHLAAYMVKFLKSISRPFVRIYNVEEINNLLIYYDAVVSGCVDVSPGSYDFLVFYNTALRFLEKDPLQEIIFALITDSQYCNGNVPSLGLHMWNETLLYVDDKWKSNELLNWILTHLHQINMWITPMGSKSMSMSSYIQPGPALILFTPRNPLHFSNDYYNMLHEVGLEYHSCGNNYNVEYGLSLIKAKRKKKYEEHSFFLNSCVVSEKVKKFLSTVTFSIPKKWANNSCCLSSSNLPKDQCLKCDPLDVLSERIDAHCHKFEGNYCDTMPNLYKVEEKEDLCEKEDYKSAKNLMKWWKQEQCRIGKIAESIYSSKFSELIAETDDRINVTGLACKSNSTLTFIALDSLRYYHFAERLGINLFTIKDKTAAVIINQKMETHHILNKAVNDKTIREFISNFTLSNLQRSYNSETTLNKNVYVNQRTNVNSTIVLSELNTNTFFPIVMQELKTVMVFYYSKQCSFCNGISYTFLTVAKMFKSINSLQFARIDGESNILPWAFTMDRYPTIILFPSKRKSESRVFPRDIPITVSTLITFILVNLNTSLRLHVMWILCNQTKFDDEKKVCIGSLQAENLSIINTTLRAWRSADLLTKKKLLYKLQSLRNLNLLLAHSPNNSRDIERYLKRLHLVAFENIKIRNLRESKSIHDEL